MTSPYTPTLFPDTDWNPEGLHCAIASGGSSIKSLSQEDAFELYKWVVIHRPNSHVLQRLQQYEFTPRQRVFLSNIEKTRHQIAQTPVSRGHSHIRPNVRRRLVFDAIEEKEVREENSLIRTILILGGAGVIFFAIIKPIIKRLGVMYEKNAGVK